MMADSCSCCEQKNTKTWMEELLDWISMYNAAVFTSTCWFLLYLHWYFDGLYTEKLRPSFVRLVRFGIDLLILGSVFVAQSWLGIEPLDAANSLILANYALHTVFCVKDILSDNILIAVPIVLLVELALHYWMIGYLWKLHPVFVLILLLLPQLYHLLEEPACSFWNALIEKLRANDKSDIRLLEERIEDLEGKLKAKQKYIDQLTIRKKNEQMMRPPQTIVQCKHKDIGKEMTQMEKKLKELEIVAKNAVEERGKVERQKEELEQTVKQLKQTQDGMKKKHKTEIQSQKENLSRAVSHSHDLKEKVAALREENVKLRSVQDELIALQGKFKQVEKNLESRAVSDLKEKVAALRGENVKLRSVQDELIALQGKFQQVEKNREIERKRHESERNSLLANNQKIKDDLTSCLSKYKLLSDQMSEFELNAAVSPPPSKQLDDIFQTVKDIFPMVKRDTVVSALVDLRKRDGGQLKGGKALTVGRIVKSLDDKINVKSELVPSCSQSECSICSIGMEVVNCYKCKQKFHTECLTEWLNNHQSQCPMCRSEWISE